MSLNDWFPFSALIGKFSQLIIKLIIQPVNYHRTQVIHLLHNISVSKTAIVAEALEKIKCVHKHIFILFCFVLSRTPFAIAVSESAMMYYV